MKVGAGLRGHRRRARGRSTHQDVQARIDLRGGAFGEQSAVLGVKRGMGQCPDCPQRSKVSPRADRIAHLQPFDIVRHTRRRLIGQRHKDQSGRSIPLVKFIQWLNLLTAGQAPGGPVLHEDGVPAQLLVTDGAFHVEPG